jgi:hypothetical protein
MRDATGFAPSLVPATVSLVADRVKVKKLERFLHARGAGCHLFSFGITSVMRALACASGMIACLTMAATHRSIIAGIEIPGLVNPPFTKQKRQ